MKVKVYRGNFLTIHIFGTIEGANSIMPYNTTRTDNDIEKETKLNIKRTIHEYIELKFRFNKLPTARDSYRYELEFSEIRIN